MPHECIFIGSSKVGLGSLLDSKRFAVREVWCLRDRVTAALKRTAVEHGLPLKTFEGAQDFTRLVEGQHPEMPFIIYQLDMLVPAHLTADRAFYNFHRGDLYHNRGPNPDVWSILLADTTTALSLHRINDKVDSGLFIDAFEIAIRDDDDPLTLRQKLEPGLPRLIESLDEHLRGLRPGRKLAGGTYRPWITEADFTIDPAADTVEIIDRKIRSQRPYNGALLVYEGVKYYVTRILKSERRAGSEFFFEPSPGELRTCTRSELLLFELNERPQHPRPPTRRPSKRVDDVPASLFDLLVDGSSSQQVLLRRLESSRRPVVVYGAGIYAYVLVRYLTACGISLSGVMVDEASKTHDFFMGRNVLITERNRLADFEVVCGVTNYPLAREKLLAAGATAVHVVDVPDFLNMPNAFMDMNFVRAHAEDFARAYESLADDLSRATFAASINTKVNEDLGFIKPYVRPDHLFFCTNEFGLTESEVLLDVGAYTGDSVKEFHAITGGKYQRIISLEPFQTTFEQLCRTIETDQLSRVLPLMVGAWDKKTQLFFTVNEMNIDNRIAQDGTHHIEVDTIDHILEGIESPITLMKLDINGAEYPALWGARETIRRNRPKIAVNLNVKEDYFRLPLLLKEIAPEIKLYLRQRNFMSMMVVLYGAFDSI